MIADSLYFNASLIGSSCSVCASPLVDPQSVRARPCDPSRNKDGSQIFA